VKRGDLGEGKELKKKKGYYGRTIRPSMNKLDGEESNRLQNGKLINLAGMEILKGIKVRN